MPDNQTVSSRILGLLAGVAVVLATGLLGAMLGGLYVRLFVPRTGMGWDQIANALGGLMLGGLIGLVVGLVVALTTSTRVRAITAAVAVVGALAMIVILRLLAGPLTPAQAGPSDPPTPVERNFSPMYMVNVRVGHSERILRELDPAARPIPFTDVELFSATPHLEHIGWGPEFTRCDVEPTREDLGRLLPLIEAAHAELDRGSCRTPNPDDLNVPVGINLDSDRRGGTIEADCLAERPAIVALAEAIAALADRLCPGP